MNTQDKKSHGTRCNKTNYQSSMISRMKDSELFNAYNSAKTSEPFLENYDPEWLKLLQKELIKIDLI